MLVNKYMKLGLGTVQFGVDYGISNTTGITPSAEVGKILDLAQLKGMRILDTAAGYGNSEAVLGGFNLENFKIVSKFLPNNTRLMISLENSLKKLNQSSIYGYLAHRPLSLLKDNSRLWFDLLELKRNGLVNKIGYSINTKTEIKLLLDKKLIPDLIQVPFNYFDRRFETEMILLKDMGCEIHTRSAFLQGLFFCDSKKLGDFFSSIKSVIINLQAQFGNGLPGMLLNFCIEKPFIDHIIVGVNNSNQLLENISSIPHSSSLPLLKEIVDNKILTPSEWPK